MLILLIAVRTPILTRQLPEFLGISRIQCLRRKTDLIRFVHVGSNRTKSKISYAWRFERPIYLRNFILRSLRKIYFLRNPTPPRSGRNTNANTSFTGSARLGHRSRFRLRVQQTPGCCARNLHPFWTRWKLKTRENLARPVSTFRSGHSFVFARESGRLRSIPYTGKMHVRETASFQFGVPAVRALLALDP